MPPPFIVPVARLQRTHTRPDTFLCRVLMFCIDCVIKAQQASMFSDLDVHHPGNVPAGLARVTAQAIPPSSLVMSPTVFHMLSVCARRR